MLKLTNSGYRADIDGLRAIAVLPVVLFHAGFATKMPGGFAGVDVFFVISGYLITGIIFRDFDNGTYSLAKFYERRIRRIFPALFAMYAAIMALSMLLLFPAEAREIGKSIASSVLFCSNVLFFLTNSYFAGSMERNPLLHTWSLSVEEQFYVLFPLVAYLLLRLAKKWRFQVLLALTVVGFVLATLAVYYDRTGAFFLVHYRAWELLAGACVAAAPKPSITKRFHAELLGIVGMIAILFSFFTLRSYSVFPGPGALAVCLGTAMVLRAGTFLKHQTIGSILSLPPFRFVGLISYSLYLWHWPIIVFAKTEWDIDTTWERLLLVGLSFLVATSSWWFIERPFRTQKVGLATKLVLWSGAAVMAVFLGCAFVLAPLNRLIWNVPPQAETILSYEAHNTPDYMRIGSCFLTSEFNDFSAYDKMGCLSGHRDRKTALILGDSHAAHLWVGLSKAYPDVDFLQATASGCKPVLSPVGEARCVELVRYVLNEVVPHRKFDWIILSARWTSKDIEQAVATAGSLSQHASQVILVGPVPEYEQSLPRLLALAIARGKSAESLVGQFEKSEPHATDRAFGKEPMPHGVAYVSLVSSFPSFGCPHFVSEGVPLQFDYGHFTRQGSACAARAMRAYLGGRQ